MNGLVGKINKYTKDSLFLGMNRTLSIISSRAAKGVFLIGIALLLTWACTPKKENIELKLWYDKPAEEWTEALPAGNGRLGAMVFGGVASEQIQFNEETLWTGAPNDYAHPGAYRYLDEIRQLLLDGKQEEAHTLAMEEFMSIPLRQREYQPFGDLYLDFPGHDNYTNYHRELDIENAVISTSYESGGVHYSREVFASHPNQVIAIHLKSDQKKALAFNARLRCSA